MRFGLSFAGVSGIWIGTSRRVSGRSQFEELNYNRQISLPFL